MQSQTVVKERVANVLGYGLAKVMREDQEA
jgi:hypothetical protein